MFDRTERFIKITLKCVKNKCLFIGFYGYKRIEHYAVIFIAEFTAYFKHGSAVVVSVVDK